jgi:hypothetical protein
VIVSVGVLEGVKVGVSVIDGDGKGIRVAGSKEGIIEVGGDLVV